MAKMIRGRGNMEPNRLWGGCGGRETSDWGWDGGRYRVEEQGERKSMKRSEGGIIIEGEANIVRKIRVMD